MLETAEQKLVVVVLTLELLSESKGSKYSVRVDQGQKGL